MASDLGQAVGSSSIHHMSQENKLYNHWEEAGLYMVLEVRLPHTGHLFSYFGGRVNPWAQVIEVNYFFQCIASCCHGGSQKINSAGRHQKYFF